MKSARKSRNWHFLHIKICAYQLLACYDVPTEWQASKHWGMGDEDDHQPKSTPPASRVWAQKRTKRFKVRLHKQYL